jgi:signal transduction histidine kinase/DNA-binding response OmpR family regulator/ligand-binding sensor domain-containing protein
MRLWIKISFWVLLQFLCVCSTSAQTNLVKIRKFAKEQGLSHQRINCIHQDRNGAVWIGTQDGLNRYDGPGFKWFTREKSGLHSNNINEIYEDEAGWLWLVHSELKDGEATYFSIDLFHPYTYQVIPFKDRFSDNNHFQVSDLRAIHQMPGGKLLFLLKNGAHFLLKGGKVFEKIAFEPGFIPHLAIDDNLVWGSAGNKLLLQNLDGKTIRSYPLEAGYDVWQLEQDGLGRLWALMERGHPENAREITDTRIVVFSGETGVKVPLPESFAGSYDTRLLFLGREKTMVVLRLGEIFEIDQDLKVVYHDTETLANQWYRQYTSTLVDRTGTIWYGHLNGLWMIELRQSLFRQYFKGPDNNPFPARGIAEYGRSLFVNGTNSLKGVILDLKTGQWHEYREMDARFATQNCFPMYLNAKRELWTATDHLFQFDSLGHVVKDIAVRTGDDSKIWSFFQDRSNTWWLGLARKYIYSFNPDQQDKPQMFEAYNGFDALQKTEKWHFLENDRGIWIAAENGLYLLDKQKGIIARYSEQEEGPHHLPALQYHYTYQDKSGNLWLATGDAGLLKIGIDAAMNPVVLQHVTRENGLPSNELYAIYEDNFNHLWISSANGLIQFSKETGDIRVYFETEGITNNEFNKLSAFQSPSGRIYFGGQNGVTAFDPKDFNQEVAYDPPIIFTEASVFSGREDRLVNITDGVLHDRQITFSPGDKFMTLQFALQDYFHSDKIRYSYQFEGLGKDWTDLNSNVLQLGGLPYGTHLLHIRGKGPDNRFSIHQLDVEVCVKRPFYLQAWFIALFLIAIGVSIWQWYSWRIQAFRKQQLHLERMVDHRTEKIREDKLVIEKQATQLKELDEIKSRFFANISHELRTPLTLILGPLQSVLKGNHLDNRDYTLLRLMQQNGEQLLRRINELLDLASLDANKLKVVQRVVVLYPFVKRILHSFESAANLKQIRLALDYQLDSHLQLLMGPDKVEKILSNFLSNALKFTPEAGKITLTTLRKANLLEIRLADTGPGIPQHEIEKIFDRFYQSEKNDQSGGTGIGLALCRELAKHMNGQVWAESQPDQGSIFYLQLPLEERFEQVLPESEPEASPVTPVNIAPKDALATILVVEDNASLREYIQILLEDYDVIAAENGQIALEKLSDCTQTGRPVNLVISDIMMPVMDGFALLKTLKEHDDYRHIPVIMLTAHQKADVKLEALRIGVDDYLVKPFQEAELLARATNLISNSRRRLALGATMEASSAPHPAGKVVLTAADARWLSDVEKIILRHIADTEFNLSQIADEMAVSPRRLQQKIKEITGLTPKDYQREIQLEYARRILEAGAAQSLSEISYKVGFKDAHYFSTLFQNRYGKKPNEYL